jgi:integrase
MSVQKRPNGNWEVRWRENGRSRSRTLSRRRDAQLFDAEVRRRREMGGLEQLTAGRTTLCEFGEEWWTKTATTLAPATRNAYATTWDRHVLPRLGGYQLQQLTPAVVEQYRHNLERDGIGDPTIRKALAVLSSALARAVVWGYVPGNPVRAIRKPKATPGDRVIVAPRGVEAMRARLLTQRRLADAALVATLAYAGLRPEEALALRWKHVGRQTLEVTHAIVDGEVQPTKTGQARSVTLLPPLAEDLAAWRLASGRPDDGTLVWPRQQDGRPWRDHDYRNWRRRLYQPLAASVGLEDRRPYTLRASFASLLVADGRTVVDVAAECGHGVEVCVRNYARLFAEFRGRGVDAVETIRAARRECDVRRTYAADRA